MAVAEHTTPYRGHTRHIRKKQERLRGKTGGKVQVPRY
ncbi:hypothetical protein JMJ77_0000387 [Colletotrichum scovillei]|uniref:Uncharacterized protein n=1 Tax=Colletotrichum scovillei TaxID=1209932 RepID=A0A9P7R9C5_9PEZI|nr:hypothetical protein JMJ77_0000387 [Colletotrichum scovillei]KAG7071593.1 hypothetical protein JMJ76_0004464 [Colletotrichum scovillei]KAG7079845.1 hypothetical protein JMJ78_0006949 [Colletotrichum scovillei]